MAYSNIKLPDGKIQRVSHPVDWSDDQIKEAVYKYMPQYKMPSKKDNAQNTGNLDDFKNKLKSMLTESAIGSVGNISQNVASSLLPQNESSQQFAKGYGQAVPRSLASGARSISQLFGKELSPEIQQQNPESLMESLGQGGGKALAYGSMAAPIVAGAEALAPAAIPEFASLLAGSGTAGAALSPKGERTSGALEFAAPVAAFKALSPTLKLFTPKSLASAFRNVVPEKTYGKIQEQYGKVKKSLEDVFDFVSDQSKERGISKVGELDEDIFKNALDYGYKTRSFKTLVEKAKTGDYDSVRRLYSRLGEMGEKAGKGNDWEKKEMMDEIRQDINSGLSEHFKNTGHKDLSQWLDAAKNGWSQLIKTYHTNPTIRKLVSSNQEVPETLKPLMKNRKDIKNVLKVHPEAQKDIDAVKTKEAFKNAYEKLKSRGLTGGILLSGAKYLKGKSED